MSNRVRRDFRAEALQLNGQFIQALIENLNAEASNDSCGFVEVLKSSITTGGERDVFMSARTETIADSSEVREKLGMSHAGQFDIKTQLGDWNDGQGILHIEDGAVDGESNLKPEQLFKVGAGYIQTFTNVETGAWEIGLSQHFHTDPKLGAKYLEAFEQAKRALKQGHQMLADEEEGILAAKGIEQKFRARGMRVLESEDLPERQGRTMVLSTEVQEEEVAKTRSSGGRKDD
jgi:hypothetical protein